MTKSYCLGLLVAIMSGWVVDFARVIDTPVAFVLGFVIVMALFYGGLVIVESFKEK